MKVGVDLVSLVHEIVLEIVNSVQGTKYEDIRFKDDLLETIMYIGTLVSQVVSARFIDTGCRRAGSQGYTQSSDAEAACSDAAPIPFHSSIITS